MSPEARSLINALVAEVVGAGLSGDSTSSQAPAPQSTGDVLSLHVPAMPATPRFDRFGSLFAVLPVWGMLAVFLWLLGRPERLGQPRPSLHLIFTPPR
jgi:hypothetical protein